MLSCAEEPPKPDPPAYGGFKNPFPAETPAETPDAGMPEEPAQA